MYANCWIIALGNVCAEMFHFCKIIVFRSLSRHFLLFPRITCARTRRSCRAETWVRENWKEREKKKKKRNKKDNVRTKVIEVERTFPYTFQTRIRVAKLLLWLFIIAFWGDGRHTFRPPSTVSYFGTAIS